MVGPEEEFIGVEAGEEIITICKCLQPSAEYLKVERFLHPEEIEELGVMTRVWVLQASNQ